MAPWAAMWLSLIMLVLEERRCDLHPPSEAIRRSICFDCSMSVQGGEPVFLLLAVFDPQGTSWRV